MDIVINNDIIINDDIIIINYYFYIHPPLTTADPRAHPRRRSPSTSSCPARRRYGVGPPAVCFHNAVYFF